MYQKVQQLPTTVTSELQAIAGATAARVRNRAQDLLREKTHGTGATAKAIGIVVDVKNKQYLVISQAPQGKAGNLPVWIEYGTVHQEARPYMRPALSAESTRYKNEIAAAAMQILQRIFG